MQLPDPVNTADDSSGSSSCPIAAGNTVNFHLPLEELLHDHAVKYLDQTSEYRLSVDRSSPESLWNRAVCFYKSAKLKPHKMSMELMVDFSATGEVGADSGALRREFFEDAIMPS